MDISQQAISDYKNPNAQKLLKMLSGAEGTLNKKTQEQQYNIMFGGSTFNDLSKHPNKVIHSTKYSSAAAGAYQFMPQTFQARAKQLGLPDFSPKSQDLAALATIRARGVNPTQPITRQMVAQLAPEWASLPNMSGVSVYGQPVKSWNELMQFYNIKPKKSVVGTVKATAAVSIPKKGPLSIFGF
jgi:lysozyme